MKPAVLRIGAVIGIGTIAMGIGVSETNNMLSHRAPPKCITYRLLVSLHFVKMFYRKALDEDEQKKYHGTIKESEVPV